MRRTLATRAVIGLAFAGLALSACDNGPKAPTETGICYHIGTQPDGTQKLNVVKRNVQSIEFCAAELEGMRVRFLRMGGQNRDLIGAYQGSYLVLRPAGVFRMERWNGAQYLMLVRTGDGRLAQPGAVPGY